MNYTPAEVEDLHRTMYESCGLEVLKFSIVQINKWKDFLFAIRDLVDSAAGKLTPKDIDAVVRFRKRENAHNRRNYAIKPSTMMENPGGFLDEVLATRKSTKPTTRTPVAAPLQPTAPTIADSTDAEIAEGAEAFRKLRETL